MLLVLVAKEGIPDTVQTLWFSPKMEIVLIAQDDLLLVNNRFLAYSVHSALEIHQMLFELFNRTLQVGDAASDTLISIENLHGSEHNDLVMPVITRLMVTREPLIKSLGFSGSFITARECPIKSHCL